MSLISNPNKGSGKITNARQTHLRPPPVIRLAYFRAQSQGHSSTDMTSEAVKSLRSLTH